MAQKEYRVSEPSGLVLQALDAAQEMGNKVSDFFSKTMGGEEADEHFNEFCATFLSPLQEYLEEQLMDNIRFNRACLENKGELL